MAVDDDAVHPVGLRVEGRLNPPVVRGAGGHRGGLLGEGDQAAGRRGEVGPDGVAGDREGACHRT